MLLRMLPMGSDTASTTGRVARRAILLCRTNKTAINRPNTLTGGLT
jgi:hypothetical protein